MAENKSQLNAAIESIPKGYGNDNPAVQGMFEDLKRQQNTAKGIVEGGIMGAAAGGQAAQGFTDPYAAFIQGAAAGLQVPAALYQKRSAELRSALDAAMLSKTMPELVYNDPSDPSKGMKPGYEVFASMPTKLAQQAIAQIGQDAIRLKMESETKRGLATINEQEAKAYAKAFNMAHGLNETTGIKPDEIVGSDRGVIEEMIRIKQGGAASAVAPVSDTSNVKEVAPGELAAQYGLPSERVNPYYNMPPKVYEKVRAANATLANKEIAKASDSASAMDNIVNSLTRANALLDSGVETGPISGRIPGRTLSNDAQEFEQIASTILPMMRQGMPGAVSDRDMAIFKEANFGLTKDENVNRKVIGQQLAIANRIKDHADFMANWATVYGDTHGAQAEWNKYTRVNPLFSVKGEPVAVQSYKDYFDKVSGRATGWDEAKEARYQELKAKVGK